MRVNAEELRRLREHALVDKILEGIAEQAKTHGMNKLIVETHAEDMLPERVIDTLVSDYGLEVSSSLKNEEVVTYTISF